MQFEMSERALLDPKCFIGFEKGRKGGDLVCMNKDLWRGADLSDMKPRVLCGDSGCERTLYEK